MKVGGTPQKNPAWENSAQAGAIQHGKNSAQAGAIQHGEKLGSGRSRTRTVNRQRTDSVKTRNRQINTQTRMKLGKIEIGTL